MFVMILDLDFDVRFSWVRECDVKIYQQYMDFFWQIMLLLCFCKDKSLKPKKIK